MFCHRRLPRSNRWMRLPIAILWLMSFVVPLNAIAGTGPIRLADFNLPAQDGEGWSIITAAPDSRLVYVDAVAGDDTTGQFYLPSDPVIGSNPRQPVGPVLAYRTIAAAHERLRRYQPDWLLLRAGGVWHENIRARIGRSASERAVFTSWGDGARPELRTGAARGIEGHHLGYAAVIGIRFWAHTRDSDGPYFTGYAGQVGFRFYTREPSNPLVVRDVLIEDCLFRSYVDNGLDALNAPITNFIIRRSIISGNYANGGRSQGLGYGGEHQPRVPAVLLQENLFDHNGWRIRSLGGGGDASDGQATFENHNTYFTAANGVVFHGNLFLRASSIGNKWSSKIDSPAHSVLVDNNLYTEGDVGMSIGGNDPGSYRFRDFELRNNVLTDIGRTRPTNRSLSWGVDVKDWDGGLVENNLVINQRNAAINNTFGLQITAETAGRDLHVVGNVVANLLGNHQTGSPANARALLRLRDGNNLQNMLLENNTFHSSSTTIRPVSIVSGGYAFAGSNRYSSGAPANHHFLVDTTITDLDGWIAATGDTGATTVAPTFPNPDRTLEGYAQHLGIGDSFDDLLAAMYGQSRASWNPALTAAVINEWMRAGFGMPPAQSLGNAIFADGFEGSR